jgi:hypothetical protein
MDAKFAIFGDHLLFCLAIDYMGKNNAPLFPLFVQQFFPDAIQHQFLSYRVQFFKVI